VYPSDTHPFFHVETKFRTARYAGLLPPIAGVVDGFGLNAKHSAQLFYQYLCPSFLGTSRLSGFAVSYNADSDSLTTAVPGPARYNRPLSLPFFGRLYLSVATAETVTDDKVAVDILGTGQAAQRGQLFNVAGFGAAIVDFDATPTAGGLRGARANSLLDRAKTIKNIF